VDSNVRQPKKALYTSQRMNQTTQNLPATDKNLEAMRQFAEQYAKRTGTYFCADLGVTAVVIEGLAKHKEDLGSPLCPCRHYEDKTAEAKAAYWNCPCVPMRERKECHCMLFLTSDNDFAGDQQQITFEQIRGTTNPA
jgi:ferredoxin-thioredoxin reductase catalytic chain